MDPSKQQLLAGKYIVGIDPAKAKHQAVILTPDGLQMGKSFAFDVSYEGYSVALWHKIALQLPLCKTDNTIFAIETSCNLWMTLAFYLKAEGYTVVMVSPLTTHLSRPMAHHDFSRTDPKDALLIASNTHHGNFDLYQEYSTSSTDSTKGNSDPCGLSLYRTPGKGMYCNSLLLLLMALFSAYPQ